MVLNPPLEAESWEEDTTRLAGASTLETMILGGVEGAEDATDPGSDLGWDGPGSFMSPAFVDKFKGAAEDSLLEDICKKW